MFSSILSAIVSIISVLPSLITTVENLWKGTPKSGPQKWIAVEAALSGSITAVAAEIAKAAPGTEAGVVAGKVDIWVKAVNDLTVGLFNDLGLLPHEASQATIKG